MPEDIQIIRSGRKTMSIIVKSDGSVVVRAPYSVSDAEINSFVSKHEGWIKKRIELQKKRAQEYLQEPKMSREEIEALAQKALKVIPERVAYFAPKVGVTYGRITIRNQKTRWGSCSAKGNLNFNCLLMLTPPEVIDSVVVHELCHRKEMNHSQKFYDEVLRVYPDYYKCHKWLKEHGAEIMRKMV